MAGVSRQGLEIKTLDDVLTDYKTNASSIFSDLVAAGDVVDTTSGSALGRMIGVIAPAEASSGRLYSRCSTALTQLQLSVWP